MYIQQPAEFSTNFLHNPNVTKTKGFEKMKTDITAPSYPSNDSMKTYSFAFTDNGLH